MKYITLLLIITILLACNKKSTNIAINNITQDSVQKKALTNDTLDSYKNVKDFYDDYMQSNLDSIDNINYLRLRYNHIANLNNLKEFEIAYYTSVKLLEELHQENLQPYSMGLVNAIIDEMNFAIHMDTTSKDFKEMFDLFFLRYSEHDKLSSSIPKDSILSIIDKMEFPENFEIVINDAVVNKIALFLTNYKKTLIAWNENKSVYDELIHPILQLYNIPHEVIYIAMIESGYKFSAISSVRAVGMWQFMPKTAKGLGANINYWEDDRVDFVKATHLAGNFLSYLYSKYDNWLLAFAAYNCGGGRVDRLLKKHNGRSVWDIYYYLPKETRNYVTSFLAVCLLSENLEKLGIEIKQKNDVDYQTTLVSGGLLLSYIAHCSDTTTTAIKNLNPQFRLGSTPTNQDEVIIKIPANKYEIFVETYNKEKGNRKSGKILIVTHTVKSGDSLYKLAKIYKTTVNKILSANTIKNSRKIKPGMKIVIPVPVSAVNR